MQQAISVSEERRIQTRQKPEEADKPEGRRGSAIISTEAVKIGESAHKIAQAFRVYRTRRDGEMKRVWGILEAKFGGMVYATLMKSDLSDDDKEFIRYTKNLGVDKKFQKKESA